MKKIYLNLLFIFLAISLVLVPCDFAWKWQTHSKIVDKIYYSMPVYIQENLDLTAMRDGSNDPDEKFQDFINHSFPGSYFKAKEWLNKGKLAYREKNYYYASYCFGVASHYISDTFSAPHSANDTSYLHSTYESQANTLKPSIYRTNDKDLYSLLKQGDRQGEKDWNVWKKTRKSSITQNNLNQATTASYSTIKRCIG